jgi:hypothetical protein
MAKRSRSKNRKRQSQRRLPSARTAEAARNRRADITQKRRRADADDAGATTRIGATPREKARGGRARRDPNNRVRSELNAPTVSRGKGGRPRSKRMRDRKAA